MILRKPMIALYTKDGEVTNEGYSRVPISFNAAVANGQLANMRTVHFPTAEEDWPEIVMAKVFAHNNIVAVAVINEPHVVKKGFHAAFAAGEFVLSIIPEETFE